MASIGELAACKKQDTRGTVIATRANSREFTVWKLTAERCPSPHRPIDVQPYPIRLVNWFMSK